MQTKPDFSGFMLLSLAASQTSWWSPPQAPPLPVTNPNKNQLGFSPLRPEDLKDPQLWKTNQAFLYLYGKLASMTGAGNPTLLSTPTFNTAKASGQGNPVKLAPTEFVTKQSADQLYQTIQDTHANRLTKYVIPSYPLGTLFYETDRGYLYILKTVAGLPMWTYLSGKAVLPVVSRPADLGALDIGAEFYGTDSGFVFNLWTGSAWVAV